MLHRDAERSTTRDSRDKASGCGVVVIGRNEGQRLRRCLESLSASSQFVVYVDSGSSDGSVSLAESHGVAVVQLDMSAPFTAARARNAGFARLQQIASGLRYVQFVDGDCEMFDTWLPAASAFLDKESDVAVVTGRLRERFPEHSIYNRLCDMEWDRPVGLAKSCGGIAMMRSEVFAAEHGFREDLIAGEEPELCVRIRARGWKVWRLALPMAWHDASILRFGQWWKRTQRGGFAAAEGAWLHGSPPERHGVTRTRGNVLWGIGLPIAIVSLSVVNPAALLLLLAYPLQVLRLALRDGIRDPARRWRALFYVVGRFPEAQGALKFWLNRLRRRRASLIEYK